MAKKGQTTIEVFELLGSNAAVSSDDGDALFERIAKAFNENREVILDFKNIDLIVSTFLNASVGQLYGSYNNDFIKDNLKVVNMTNDDLSVLKKVVDRAKEYFFNKNDFENTIKNSFPDE